MGADFAVLIDTHESWDNLVFFLSRIIRSFYWENNLWFTILFVKKIFRRERDIF